MLAAVRTLLSIFGIVVFFGAMYFASIVLGVIGGLITAVFVIGMIVLILVNEAVEAAKAKRGKKE